MMRAALDGTRFDVYNRFMETTPNRVGRPPGRKAPHKPVVSARVPAEVYERLQSDAKKNGRTLGQEIALRLTHELEQQPEDRTQALLQQILATLEKRARRTKPSTPRAIDNEHVLCRSIDMTPNDRNVAFKVEAIDGRKWRFTLPPG